MAAEELIVGIEGTEELIEELLSHIVNATNSDHGAVLIYSHKSDRFYLIKSTSDLGKEIWEDIAREKCLSREERKPIYEKVNVPVKKSNKVISYVGCHPLTFSVAGITGFLFIAREKDKSPYKEELQQHEKTIRTLNIAINSLLLENLTRENLRLLEMLNSLMKLFQKRDFKENLIETVLKSTKEFFKANYVMLTTAMEDKKELKINAHIGLEPLKDTIAFGEGASGIAAKTKEPCIIEEYPPELLPASCKHLDSIIGSAIAIPIFVKGKLYGTISLCRTKKQPRFTVNELNVLKSFQILLSFLFSLYEYEKEKALFDQISFRTQKMEALGVLAGGIAHDFNNIINIILGFSQVCMEKVKDKPEVLEYLSIITDECKKAAALISQILYFSREETGKKQDIDLKPMIKQLSKVISRTLPENIRVNYEDDGHESYYVHGSPENLHAALMNILANAKDAMPEGGCLTLRLRKEEFEEETPYPRKSVIIEIADTGCGIPEEHLEKIFDPFFTTKGDRGTGLGLYQTYNIIKNLNGTIDVESTPGRGTTFKIYLPECKPKKEQNFYTIDSAPPAYPDVKLKGEILVVEDNPQLLNAILTMLREVNIDAKGFTDPQEAFNYFKDHQENISILITDMVMPHMDGINLSDKMREIKPELKVIYMTGYTNKAEELISRAQEKGTFVMLKPFTSFELVNAIKKVTNN